VLGAVVHNAEEVERALLMSFTREPNGGLVVPSGPATTSHQALVMLSRPNTGCLPFIRSRVLTAELRALC
jgi:hypothetical protein